MPADLTFIWEGSGDRIIAVPAGAHRTICFIEDILTAAQGKLRESTWITSKTGVHRQQHTLPREIRALKDLAKVGLAEHQQRGEEPVR